MQPRHWRGAESRLVFDIRLPMIPVALAMENSNSCAGEDNGCCGTRA